MRNPFKMPNRMIVKENNAFIPICLITPFLSSEECDLIIQKMQNHERLKWGLVGNGKENSYVPAENNYRVVRVADLLEEDFPWVYEKIKTLVRTVNDGFEFDLYGIMDDIMFMRYDAPMDGHSGGQFQWHADNGADITGMRKISMSIGLNNPSEYDGGEFQIFNNGEHNYGKIEQGVAISFPSFRPHRVTEITKGTRYVLVLFVLGPKYR